LKSKEIVFFYFYHSDLKYIIKIDNNNWSNSIYTNIYKRIGQNSNLLRKYPLFRFPTFSAIQSKNVSVISTQESASMKTTTFSEFLLLSLLASYFASLHGSTTDPKEGMIYIFFHFFQTKFIKKWLESSSESSDE